jgi:Winged helix-turn-helix DNA-binding
MYIEQGGAMKIISLLGALAVLVLMMTPAFSQPGLKVCTCMPGDSHGKPVEKCCSKCSDNSIAQGCTCPGQMGSYSGTEYYDPSLSYFSKSDSRSLARPGSISQISSSNSGAFSPAVSVATNSIGPPDPDVVEYLPPSAKQVLLVLASDGPLTQKDIIGKTDLPPRTVRYALGRLKGEEMLQERFCFSDARQSLYSLNGMAMK